MKSGNLPPGIPSIHIVRRKILGFKAPIAVSELMIAHTELRRGKGVAGTEVLVLAEHDFVSKQRPSAELISGSNLVLTRIGWLRDTRRPNSTSLPN